MSDDKVETSEEKLPKAEDELAKKAEKQKQDSLSLIESIERTEAILLDSNSARNQKDEFVQLICLTEEITDKLQLQEGPLTDKAEQELTDYQKLANMQIGSIERFLKTQKFQIENAKADPKKHADYLQMVNELEMLKERFENTNEVIKAYHEQKNKVDKPNEQRLDGQQEALNTDASSGDGGSAEEGQEGDKAQGLSAVQADLSLEEEQQKEQDLELAQQAIRQAAVYNGGLNNQQIETLVSEQAVGVSSNIAAVGAAAGDAVRQEKDSKQQQMVQQTTKEHFERLAHASGLQPGKDANMELLGRAVQSALDCASGIKLAGNIQDHGHTNGHQKPELAQTPAMQQPQRGQGGLTLPA